MKNQINLLLSAAVCAFAFQSCTTLGCMDKDAENYNEKATEDNGECLYKMGCTDAKASNYDAIAKKDDGTCTYTGTVMFWASEKGTDSDISVTLYDKNGYYPQTASDKINAYQASAPTCGTLGTVTAEKVEGTYIYKAKRADNSESWEGSYTVKKGLCTKVYLEPQLKVSARVWTTGTSTGSNQNKFSIENICSDSYRVVLNGPSYKSVLVSNKGSYYSANIKDGTYKITITNTSGTSANRYCLGTVNVIENVVVSGSKTINLSIGS